MPTYSILHTESSLGWGGQEIRIFNEMVAMGKRGHTVALATPSSSHIYKEAKEAGIETVALSDSRLAMPNSIIKLSSWMRKVRPDVVNTHSSRDGWIGGLAARLAGVRLIIRSRHIDVDYPNRLRSRMAYGLLPHHLLTTSEAISNGLIQRLSLDRERVTCIPTGVDVERYRPGLGKDARKEWNIDVKILLIGIVAVLRSWKGHIHFLETARLVLEHLPHARFLIVGEGPQREAIEKQIGEWNLTHTVTLTGHRTDIPELLNALDLLLITSTAHEGIPQIALQAQACGVPVVGTKVGGIPEVIEHGITGLLVEPKEPQAMCGEIMRLLGDEELRRSIAAKARERVMEKHSTNAMCQKLEAIYSRYLAK